MGIIPRKIDEAKIWGYVYYRTFDILLFCEEPDDRVTIFALIDLVERGIHHGFIRKVKNGMYIAVSGREKQAKEAITSYQALFGHFLENKELFESNPKYRKIKQNLEGTKKTRGPRSLQAQNTNSITSENARVFFNIA